MSICTLAIDISSGHTWENNLTAHIDDLPFGLIGRGEQNALKTLLALGNRAHDAQVILIEEPETHLDFPSLRGLLARIAGQCEGRQILVVTHSTFVLNKLGLDSLVLVGEGAAVRITDLPTSTVDYFKKLPGFDTLRLVLAREVILVEGPSDELVVQRAYRDINGRAAIDDGVDVISVGLSHKRFLDLALRLGRRVKVVTDNDGKTLDQVRERFSDYLGNAVVTLHVSEEPTLRTLEPCIAAVNTLQVLNEVLGARHATKEDACRAMMQDKTAAALRIFEHPRRITLPEYLLHAVAR